MMKISGIEIHLTESACFGHLDLLIKDVDMQEEPMIYP